ncbi:MAG: hypothetical protein ACFFF4_18295 [Candidatus Thorarchaeota archaeon]
MKEKAEPTKEELKLHRKMAAQYFNQTWDLMEKENRTKEDDDLMIHTAHASRYHWGILVSSDKYDEAGPENLERGEWQISRMYTVLKRPEPALHHAQRCLDICKENKIGDWDIAFAYEAMARANSIAKNKEETNKFLKLAKEAGEKIKKKEDKDYLLSEIKTIQV